MDEIDEAVDHMSNVTESDVTEQLLKTIYAHSIPPECALVVDQMSCTWTEGTSPVLSNINLRVKKGELLVVVGPVGSGKVHIL